MTTDTKKLRELLSKATKGPWQIVMARNEEGSTCYMVREHTHSSVVVERDQYWPENYEPKTDSDGYWLPDEKMDALPHRVGNAALIVAAVNALPALLDEVEGLREDRDRMRGGIVEACDLLMERTHGSPARSPSHNARLKLHALLGETK